MRIDWRCAELFSGPYEIFAHQPQCAFNALMIAGPPMSAFALSLEVPYLNNLTHIAFLLSPSGRLAFQ